MTQRALASFPLLFVLFLLACDRDDRPALGAPAPSAPLASVATGPRGAPVKIVVAYGSEKKTWLEEQIAAFEASGARTRAGRPIAIEARGMGSGEAVTAIASGALRPHVFSPASALHVALLNDAWQKASGTTRRIAPEGEPLLLSPVVVAMWRPMAEALGWPGKPIGWADLIRVGADPKGWGALGHPEWGRFKLGHTHPEHSSSGRHAVLAEAYAGARKTRDLGVADLERKAVEDHVASIEQTIVHYGTSTGLFADKMLERGPDYLSAAVLYENLVVESRDRPRAPGIPPLVAVYPVEGTFWADHPYAILDADWVGAAEREAAEALLAFLRARPQQERALARGFRPADRALAIGAPIDADHGVDARQPQTVLGWPDVPALEALVKLWRRAKKASDVILVLDKSGSMQGKPIAEAKAGARAFLRTLRDDDEVSIVLFDAQVYPPFGPRRLGDARAEIDGRIDGVIAAGGTALYDATAEAFAAAKKRAEKAPGRIHAVVVMTDGRDENSRRSLAALRAQIGAAGGDVKVFTIAYGEKADGAVLGQIAEAAGGASRAGSTATIVEVFRDMATFF